MTTFLYPYVYSVQELFVFVFFSDILAYLSKVQLVFFGLFFWVKEFFI